MTPYEDHFTLQVCDNRYKLSTPLLSELDGCVNYHVVRTNNSTAMLYYTVMTQRRRTYTFTRFYVPLGSQCSHKFTSSD